MTSSERPGTLTLADSVELAVLERSGFDESRHAGAAVVVDATGAILAAHGDVEAGIYPRSCMKPFQALAVLESGVSLSSEQTVLATASHRGTQRHVDVVRSILAKAGLTEDDLGCPTDWPEDSASRDAMVRDGRTAERVLMNCSGKHAAMLAACVANDWPIESYLDVDHPLQRRISAIVSEYTGEPIRHTGIDGCGAPVHVFSLVGLARGFSRVASATSGSAQWLTQSILSNGWAIDGPGGANTVVIDTLGVLAKLGAEGVMVMSTTSGVATAVKVLDGNLRAASAVALTLLVRAGAIKQSDVDALLPQLGLAVYGGGAPVGTIRVTVPA